MRNVATIATSIELTDRVSASLNRIQSNLNATAGAFRAADRVSEQCFNAHQISAISQEMTTYNSHIDRLERELQDANRQLVAMRNNTDGVSSAGGRLSGVFGKLAGIVAGLGILSAVQSQVSAAIQGASD